jgi:5'-nucleotidase
MAALLAAFALAARTPGRVTLTLLHVSDYHSHAVPFFTGEGRAAGIARAIRFLAPFGKDPKALVFSGGDMLNRGAPTFSDAHRCVEWPWLNGIVSAMAYGNHDADYGPEELARCRAPVRFPILSANVVGEDGKGVFAPDAVFERSGVRIGVFAVAGSDFSRLVSPAALPAKSARFLDPIPAARAAVASLRGEGRANAVVLIGHELHEEDIALARAVPGIDLVFGSHSHRREELTLIPGTRTYTISPYQYLEYVSRVELTFQDGALAGVTGGLVPMDAALPEDPAIARRVAALQAQMEADPKYAPLFAPLGRAAAPLLTDGAFARDAALPDLAMDLARAAAKTDVALSTASAFREPIADGVMREEDLRAALPYTNELLVYELPGPVLQALLDASAAAAGTDFFLQVSGVRFTVSEGKAKGVRLVSPGEEEPIAGETRRRVAITDFTALVAPPYKPLLAPYHGERTGLFLRDVVRERVKGGLPVSAHADGRIGGADSPGY